jgi:hypothetical protein
MEAPLQTLGYGNIVSINDERCKEIPQILATLMMEVLGSSEKPVLTRSTRRNISEDGILHGHHREFLRSYTASILIDA